MNTKSDALPAVGWDALLADLVEQRGDVRICFDEEDGWFVKTMQNRSMEESWMTLDAHEERHSTPTAALLGAIKAHNKELYDARAKGRFTINRHISANASSDRIPGHKEDSH